MIKHMLRIYQAMCGLDAPNKQTKSTKQKTNKKKGKRERKRARKWMIPTLLVSKWKHT